MTFPDKRPTDIAAFAEAYFQNVAKAAGSIDRARIAAAAAIVEDTHRRGSAIFACGNGGSAAIANHLMCDHCKGAATDTALRPRVHSLSANIEIITAIANDLSYADIFAYQVRNLARPGDVLVTISSSGDSENIVRAADVAASSGMKVIALTGFDGGRSARIADVNLHVAADNYGVIEDVHQSLMHILAQWLRLAHMDPALIPQRKF
ncbi:MAG: SIS domain-containing protein [Alphaproteobacteria bacterium]|nr:SIS domain-containing protein [Alphaproteobacteria bacterium]